MAQPALASLGMAFRDTLYRLADRISIILLAGPELPHPLEKSPQSQCDFITPHTRKLHCLIIRPSWAHVPVLPSSAQERPIEMSHTKCVSVKSIAVCVAKATSNPSSYTRSAGIFTSKDVVSCVITTDLGASMCSNIDHCARNDPIPNDSYSWRSQQNAPSVPYLVIFLFV